MTVLELKPWLRRAAVAAVTVAALAAPMVASAPAEARVFVSVGVPGWGYYAPPYYPYRGYYGYAPYSYYGYPYAYPARVYFGRPWYGHRYRWHGRWYRGWR